MSEFLTETEFLELQPELQAGKARLCIPRSISRDFFIRVSNSSVENTTGHSLRLKKFVIWTGVAIPPLMFIACAAHVINEFAWTATLLIPLLGIFWTIVTGLTGDRGNFLAGTVAMLLAVGIASLLPQAYAVILLLISLSLWLHRCVFFLAQHWLVQLLAQSYPAFDMLVEHIEIQRGQTDS
ncbi:MAG: hypothetical protein KDI36_17010 [Pseudomonadales bacterium]|nr:hypothetical protein [Pseudomonadales bacterium]